jgi:hypothetical protein
MTIIEVTRVPADNSRPLPLEAVEALEATWIRCRMAGIQLARNDAVVRRFGWVVTGLTALTSTGIFATLQQAPGDAARAAAGSVLAAAAVLAAWQTRATKQAQTEAKAMTNVLRTFHDLHERLLSALSTYQQDGTLVPQSLLAEAKAARDRHVLDMGAETPSYEAAARSVAAEMRDLGLLARPAAR